MYKYNTKVAIIFIFLLFLINPICGILLATLFACRDRDEGFVKALIFLNILYVCALNTTKVPENDMIRYLLHYEYVPINGYKETLMWTGRLRDVLYSSLVYLLYYVTFGNQYLFIFLITFAEYWFMSMAIFKFGKEYHLPKYLIITELLILFFFTQYFGLTFHLVRQVLATCIFFYALTFRSISFRKFLLWSIVSLGIHSSIGVLVVMSILPMMKRRLRLIEIGYLVLFAAFFVVIASTFAAFLLDNFEVEGSIEYTLSRAAGMEGAADNTAGMQLTGLVFSVITLILCLIEWGEKSDMKYPIVINLALATALMVIGLTSSPLIQYRFYFFLYSFFPLLIPLFLRKKIELSKMFCFAMVAFLMVLFYVRLNHVFQFAPVEQALFSPYPFLIKLF